MIIKNSNVRQYLAHNRYFILFGVIGLILLLLILGNLNTKEKEKQERKKQENKTNTTTSNVYKPNETVISGGNVSQPEQEKNEKVINEFVQACNQKDIKKAYNLLTIECKDELYPTINIFKTNYVDKKFNIPRQHSMQSWYADRVTTYKVVLTEDMLATGKVQTANSLEEYITIVNTKEGAKLNINNYIERRGFNESQNNRNGVTIQVKSKDVYKDYEIYTIQVKNQTQNKVLLSDRNATNSVYIQSKSGGQYRGLTYELSEADLLVNPGNSKQIKIKFNKVYNPSTIMTNMTINNIILNYEEYINLSNKVDYKNTANIQIEL